MAILAEGGRITSAVLDDELARLLAAGPIPKWRTTKPVRRPALPDVDPFADDDGRFLSPRPFRL
jgi:sigma54-dependent transcription regulator